MKIVMQGEGSGGVKSLISWNRLIDGLVRDGTITLHQGEYISEIEIIKDVGIQVTYERM